MKLVSIDIGKLWILQIAALQWVREHPDDANAAVVRQAAQTALIAINPVEPSGDK